MSKIQVKERPILFSAPMVRALLNGGKTQNRYVVKFPRENIFTPDFENAWVDGAANCQYLHVPYQDKRSGPDNLSMRLSCPHAEIGGRLWVREAYSLIPDPDVPSGHSAILYEADGDHRGRLEPSIHMPRWASRIDLEIIALRVERLQDISEADALAEGVQKNPAGGFFAETGHAGFVLPVQRTAKGAFNALWDSNNGRSSWKANPLVWIVEFKKLEQAR